MEYKFAFFQNSSTCPSTITVSMAQSAASAVSILNSKVPPKLDTSKPDLGSKNKHRIQQASSAANANKTQSPISSQSWSRNSSISPRDRSSGPVSIIARSTSSSRMSPMISVNTKPGSATGSGSSQVSPKPLFRPSSTKKKSTQFVGPLIPWAKRNCGPPKHSNGWGWLGEGTEQVVYLNVS